MHIVTVESVLMQDKPRTTATCLEEIVGRTLGSISVQELMHAAHAAKADPDVIDEPAPALIEVHVEGDEE